MAKTVKQRGVHRAPLLIAGCVLIVAAALVGTLPFILMLANRGRDAAADAAHDRAAAALTAKARHYQWARAVKYNRRLAASGQPTLGATSDPFTGKPVAGSRDYESQLTLPADGVMSVIRYPRLGINLPVRHGTDSDTLMRGAGHLFGSSLPVGGKSTHTVISAHSGMADRVMFDRLDGLGGQARKGDVFYLVTLGKPLAYRVYDIRVVQPTDFKALRIVHGRDIATLLTCTPYGVNTMRLLVTGRRAKIPSEAPAPARAPVDWSWLTWLLAILAVIGLAVAAAVKEWREK